MEDLPIERLSARAGRNVKAAIFGAFSDVDESVWLGTTDIGRKAQRVMGPTWRIHGGTAAMLLERQLNPHSSVWEFRPPRFLKKRISVFYSQAEN